MKTLNKLSYKGFLNKIGIYGMDKYEDIILIPLITEDPIILIGEYGTGKTQLLNNLAKILNLKHQHYNASLISFEDLIGYPFPNKKTGEIEFMKTEASVWDANSILIDEINRCKPEIQNKFFSLIYERKLEGMELKNLIYRWAAMNPPPYLDEDNLHQEYEGVNYLDKALADRFSMFIKTPIWTQLDESTKNSIISDRLEKELAPDKDFIETLTLLKKELKESLGFQHHDINKYSIFVADSLAKNGIDLSTRRVKMIVKNLITLSVITGKKEFLFFYDVLHFSIPHRCFGVRINSDLLKAIHDKAFTEYINGNIDYFHKFYFVRNFIQKTEILINKIKDPYERGLLLTNFINDDVNPIHKKAYLYTLFPLLMSGRIDISFQALELVFLNIMDFYKYNIEIDNEEENDISLLINLNNNFIDYISSKLNQEDNSKMVNFIKLFLFKIVEENPEISKEIIDFLINEMKDFCKEYYFNEKEEL